MNPQEREEIKCHLDVVAESLRSEIRMVAEGVATNTDRIDQFREETRTQFAELFRFRDDMYAFRSETRQDFVELRSMIKLSYAELERRLASLEEGYGDLKTRMERVEARLAS
jgi:hypothetical protein